MKRSAGLATTVAVAATLVVAAPSSAHVAPAACLDNGIDLKMTKDKTFIRPGDVLTYGLWVDNSTVNPGIKPCHITGSDLKIRLPTATGAPSATAQTLLTNRAYDARDGAIGGFPLTEVATIDWHVVVNAGVTKADAESALSGTLHDHPQDTSFADFIKSLSTQVTQPKLDLDKTGSLTSGQAPQTVTYTYAVTNTSTTPVPMDQVGVKDDLCPNVSTTPTGDNGDGLLTNGEVWYFTCTATYTTAGTYINTAGACAVSKVDNRPVCSPPDTWTVTITPPPPTSSVLPASVTQAPCVLRTATSLRVRAGQRNTIRVTARTDAPVANKRVTVRLPGGKRVSGRTNASGVATIRVRPPRSGRATITAPDCASVRVSVAAARRTAARRIPRVTG